MRRYKLHNSITSTSGQWPLQSFAMRAAAYDQFGGTISIREMPDPSAPDDGVVIRVEACGICASDWHGWMGHDSDIKTLPHVPGHELAGSVDSVGPEVRKWKVGDRVTVPFCVGCGSCEACHSGLTNICDNHFQPGFTAWGAFAERVAIPHADLNLVSLPPALDAITAASLGCRFATAWRAVTAVGRVTAGEWVVVFGCGGVGLSAIMIATAFGAHVIGVDIDHAKLDVARTMGAEHVVLEESQTVQAVREITSGGAHLSLDAVGSAAACRNSILGLRKRGRHVQVGLMVGRNADPPLPMSAVIARELEILGSHGMEVGRYPGMIGMIQSGKVNPGRLVTKVVSLEQAPAELTAIGQFRTVGVSVIDLRL